MKLACLQENLNQALKVVKRATARRSTLPITLKILLATDKGRLKLVGTNLEMAISCWIGAKVEEEGTITIPAKLLAEFIGSLPADKIDIALTGLDMKLKCAQFEAAISGVDAKDFPPIPQVKGKVVAKIDINYLRQAINRVAFAAATGKSRPVLTGIYTKFESNQMTMVGADGLRLAVCKTKLDGPASEAPGIIIPVTSLSNFYQTTAKMEGTVEITIASNGVQAMFRLHNIEMITQLVQGTYPNYAQLIPQSYTNRVVVGTSDFLQAVKAAYVFAKETSGVVRIISTENKLSISSLVEDIGKDTNVLGAVVEGKDMKIAFNGKYLIDVLKVLGKDSQVVLKTQSYSSPGVFQEAGSDDYTHVIMPMFVQW